MLKELPEDPSFVKDIDESLDKFEQDLCGLPKWSNMNPPQYLYMNISDLSKKSPDELSEAIFALNQYGMNIQRLINRLRAWERWCLSRLDQLEAHYILEVAPCFGFNERPKLARFNPEPCKKIHEFLRKIRMQIDRTWDLPAQIKIMSDSVKDLKFTALRREQAYAREQ